jgi:hypothetical protein
MPARCLDLINGPFYLRRLYSNFETRIEKILADPPTRWLEGSNPPGCSSTRLELMRGIAARYRSDFDCSHCS